MNQLVFQNNDQVVTSSRNVARDFNKEHRAVLKAIDDLIKDGVALNNADLFYETTYTHEQNKQEYRQYLMNRDGFTLLVMGFTGKKAMDFKFRYMNAFNEMEKTLQNNVVPLSKEQALVTVLRTTADLVESHEDLVKEQHEIRKMITQVDQKVEEQITLDHGEQRRLQKAVATKVYELSDDPRERSKLFREIYREIKDRFAVASYKDVKRKELQSAIRYVENWIPRKVS